MLRLWKTILSYDLMTFLYEGGLGVELSCIEIGVTDDVEELVYMGCYSCNS